MDSEVLAKKDVNFHGIWKAGYRVSDNLIKSIGADVSSKPSRPCTLLLTPAGLSLELPTSADGKARMTDYVSFDVLRDIFVNSYHPTCLNIIYLDPQRRFSVMACSSQEQKDLEDVSRAFKDHKNFLLRTQAQPQTSLNWMFRQKQNSPPDGKPVSVKENSVKSGSSHRVAGPQELVGNGAVLPNERYGSSRGSQASFSYIHGSASEDNIDEDVFQDSPYVVVYEPEDLVREPASWILDGQANAFSVGTQTAPDDDEYDVESITTATTLQSVQSDTVAASEDMKIGTPDENISAEVYHKRSKTQETRNMNEVHPNLAHNGNEENNIMEKPDTDVNHPVVPLTNGPDNGIENVEGTDLRSVGTQTIISSRGRYRKQMMRSTYNLYKEKAEASTRKTSGSGPRSPTSGGAHLVRAHAPAPRPRSSITSSSAQNHSMGASVDTTKPVKRTLSLGSTTVIKPIESVYLGRTARRSLSGRSQRPIIIYAPKSPNRFV